MSTKWISNALDSGSKPSGIDTAMKDQFVVLLLYGKNSFGDKIYSYLKITLPDLQNLKAAIQSGKGFNPSDFGTILAAGKGDPTAEVRAEISSLYQVLDSQQPAKPVTPVIPETKKKWDEY